MKTLTPEQEVEAGRLEEKLTDQYDNFRTEKRFPVQVYQFKQIQKSQQEYWRLTETYFMPYERQKRWGRWRSKDEV